MKYNAYRLKVSLAEMLVGGVIIDVTSPEQAALAEDAGASGVMVVESLASLGVDYIDESEVLTPINQWAQIRKSDFRVPFIGGAQNLVEAMRRISEGAAIVRCTAEQGTGNVALAVQQLREMAEEARSLQQYSAAELPTVATEMGVPHSLLVEVARRGRLPVVTFGAGGVATPADAALLRRFGADCVCVGSGIFHSSDPRRGIDGHG